MEDGLYNYSMKPIHFGSLTIAEDKPVVIIAEIAVQHEGRMEAAKRLIDAAKTAGADVAKFQLHVPEAEMVPDSIQFWGGSMDQILRDANFATYEQHKELKDYCQQVCIQYLCTPFCIAAVDILEKVGVDGYKTGSGELTNLPMMRRIAKTGKPVIVSTGMSTMEEIATTISVLKSEGIDFVLTHCLSEYPPHYSHMNLGLITKLKEKFDVMIGSSDHSIEIYSALAAVALGARVLEKHFTLPDLHGPDDTVSLNPTQFKEMVQAVRKIEVALGTEKTISVEEEAVRDWAHHSVIAAQNIRQGDIFSLENLVVKRPGRGIPARFLDPLFSDKLIGKKAAKDLPINTIIQWGDVV